jgi:hypothetical protein
MTTENIIFNMVIVEYIWLDNKYNYRSKTRILNIDYSYFEDNYKTFLNQTIF